MMDRVNRWAFQVFGSSYTSTRLGLTRSDLLRARIYVPVEKWLSVATLYSVAFSILASTAWFLGEWALYPHLLLDTVSGRLAIPPAHPVNILGNILFALMVPLLSFSLVFFLFYSYPRLRASERRRSIDAHLPYAIAWMSSMASIGVIPYTIFKKLAEAQEYYGEVSGEAKQVVRDVELLGYDFISALRNMCNTTPSVRLRAFIQGALTSTLSGAEMGNYFLNKARENLEENRKSFADFVNTLGMISEVYITGLVAAPLFVIVMFAAMAMVRGASPILLMAVVYGMIPIGSIVFYFLIESLTPAGGGK